MPVPDEVVFGPDPSGSGQLTYGDVRKLESDGDKFQALRSRLDDWLIGQMKAITTPEAQAPFPLAVMTCIAIETLGQVFFGDSFNEAERSRSFKDMLKKVDNRFPRKISMDRKAAFLELWPAMTKAENYSDIVYSFFRNTLVHGYRSQGVFLTADETANWDFNNGYLRLNPFWFWAAFEKAYRTVFESVVAKPECKEFQQSLVYFQELLT